jgi:hypothetical protein
MHRSTGCRSGGPRPRAAPESRQMENAVEPPQSYREHHGPDRDRGRQGSHAVAKNSPDREGNRTETDDRQSAGGNGSPPERVQPQYGR